jgi:hypothetical protein
MPKRAQSNAKLFVYLRGWTTGILEPREMQPRPFIKTQIIYSKHILNETTRINTPVFEIN